MLETINIKWIIKIKNAAELKKFGENLKVIYIKLKIMDDMWID